jgi:hypothetical protein
MVFPSVGVGVGVGVSTGVGAGVNAGVGVGVPVVLLQAPTSRATKARSSIENFLISFTSLKEDTTSEAAGQWDGD